MPVDMKHQYKAVESVALSEITVCYLQKRCVPAAEPPADSADLPVPIHEHCTTTSSAIGNWHSAGSLGWPFAMLKYKYSFQIIYMEASIPYACSAFCLQCFAAVGWAAGRASGL